LGEKALNGLLLVAAIVPEFDFGALLLFGLLLDTLAPNLGDLLRVFAGNIFFVLKLQNRS